MEFRSPIFTWVLKIKLRARAWVAISVTYQKTWNFLKISFYFFKCVYASECRCPWRPEQSTWSPGPRVTCSCERPAVGTGNQVWVLCSSSPCSYPQIYLSGPQKSYFRSMLPTEICDPHNIILNDFISKIKREEKQS